MGTPTITKPLSDYKASSVIELVPICNSHYEAAYIYSLLVSYTDYVNFTDYIIYCFSYTELLISLYFSLYYIDREVAHIAGKIMK